MHRLRPLEADMGTTIHPRAMDTRRTNTPSTTLPVAGTIATDGHGPWTITTGDTVTMVTMDEGETITMPLHLIRPREGGMEGITTRQAMLDTT